MERPKVFVVPPGRPETWPAGEALDALACSDIVGDGSIYLPATTPVSQSDAAALAHLEGVARSACWLKDHAKFDVTLTHQTPARSFWTYEPKDWAWRCELSFEHGKDDDRDWESEGFGDTLALAVAHALVQIADEKPWTITEVVWWDLSRDEDDDYDGDPIPFVIGESVPG